MSTNTMIERPVELDAAEVAVYTAQEDGALTSISEKYPLVTGDLLARVTVMADMTLPREELAARLEKTARALRQNPDFHVSEPRTEVFCIEA